MVARLMGMRPPTKEPDPKIPQGQWAIHLRSLIEAAGISIEKFAKDSGKSRAMVFQYLRGDAVAHINDWPALAKALGLKDWQELCPPAKKRK